jgi:hypothetical protein
MTVADVRALFEGAASLRSTAQVEPWPAPLRAEAFRGLAGQVIKLIAPHSEADPAALLVQFLVAFGNAIGRGPFFEVEGDRHATNLFAVMVGETAKARKGTSWSRIRRLFTLAEETWVTSRVASGLSSGEGLIWAVRDPIERQGRIGERNETRYQTVLFDPGVEDKRLLILEEEFASTLRVMGREGNTLSPIIRRAWDDGNLSTLVKNSPCRASRALISIIGHITAQELRQYLTGTEAANGFANRFLFVCVRRSKLLPEGGCLSDSDLAPVARQTKEALAAARRIQAVRRNEEATVLWRAIYGELSEGRPGLLGAVISRAEAQTMRLAMIYALLDGSCLIAATHLQAALEVWKYCEASARCIFGSALGDSVADRIRRALLSSPEGLMRTDISNLLGRNTDQARIDRALGLLSTMGAAKCVREESGGRPGERWLAC